MSATFLRAITGAVLRALGPGESAGTGDRRQVRLLANPGSGTARTLEERLIVSALASTGPLTVDEVVSGVSRTLYHEEWRRGGWSADIGIVRPRLFAPDIARALAAGDGRLWTISA